MITVRIDQCTQHPLIKLMYYDTLITILSKVAITFTFFPAKNIFLYFIFAFLYSHIKTMFTEIILN